ncbi:MAG TPA: hypothetical protein VMW57_05550 [Methyloceanibacter sp.]|nr:hypothetical protein [Methyloceanibacter sp.]
MRDKQIPLAELPRKLREEFGLSVSYRRVYGLVLDGVVPAEKDERSARWFVSCDDLAEIAKSLVA